VSAEDLGCQDVVEVVTDYLEGRLPAGEAERLEAHLRLCAGCEAYVAQIRIVLRLGGASRDREIAGLVQHLVPAFRSYRRGLT
jgi:anti-sigma factor RsiW